MTTFKHSVSITFFIEDEYFANILWNSIHPNFSIIDEKDEKLKVEFKGNEINLILRDDNLNKLRARLTSLLVWGDIVYKITELIDNLEKIGKTFDK